jgi:hypothetical protein
MNMAGGWLWLVARAAGIGRELVGNIYKRPSKKLIVIKPICYSLSVAMAMGAGGE